MSVFTLPFTIEPTSIDELLQVLAAEGICPKCPAPREGRRNRSLEIKYRGVGSDWYQCTRCARVFVVPTKRSNVNNERT